MSFPFWERPCVGDDNIKSYRGTISESFSSVLNYSMIISYIKAIIILFIQLKLKDPPYYFTLLHRYFNFVSETGNKKHGKLAIFLKKWHNSKGNDLMFEIEDWGKNEKNLMFKVWINEILTNCLSKIISIWMFLKLDYMLQY